MSLYCSHLTALETNLLSTSVGVGSGVYIFKPPLEKYWREQEAQAAAAGTHAPVPLGKSSGQTGVAMGTGQRPKGRVEQGKG